MDNNIQAFANLANEIGAAQVDAYSGPVSEGYRVALAEAIESLQVIPSRMLWEAAKHADKAGQQVIEDELMRRAEAA